MFNGKTALVTGASRGLGFATARALLDQGANVALVSRDAARLQAANEELAALTRTLAIPADVSDEAAVQGAFAKAVERFGAVDLLVNAAGAALVRKAADTSLDEWNRILAVNATGPFLTCREALRRMIPAKIRGRIVNVASVSGATGASLASAYSASKAALLGLTRSLAREAAAHGVNVNAVCPGAMDTDMLRQDTLGPMSELFKMDRESLLKHSLAAIPLKRLLSAGEVADLVVFLLSDKAAGITGQSYNVCCGLDIH